MTDPLRRVRVDRRTTIKWLAATMSAAYAGCSSDEKYLGDEIPPGRKAALLGTAATPGEAGYGRDPDLVNPVAPWPRTMTEAQLRTAAALCDTILPEDEQSPAASAVGVHDFIDEWVSAPYSQQGEDRDLILTGLEWLERQSRERFDSGFAAAAEEEKAQLLDLVVGPAPVAPDSANHDQAEFFRRFRYLAVGAFYTTGAGMDDVGYIGNVPIAGEYPGPSDAAMAHLTGVLEELGLPLQGR